jgi:hypothetical protein
MQRFSAEQEKVRDDSVAIACERSSWNMDKCRTSGRGCSRMRRGRRPEVAQPEGRCPVSFLDHCFHYRTSATEYSGHKRSNAMYVLLCKVQSDGAHHDRRTCRQAPLQRLKAVRLPST